MSAQNTAYARARIQNFVGQFPAYVAVADILLAAIEGGADAVGQALTVLIRIAEGFALLYQKRRISLDLTLALRKREAEVIGLLVAGAIAEADVSRMLEGARDLVEQLEAAERARVAAQEKREAEQAEQKTRLLAAQMGVGEILADIERGGARLSLQGEQIVCSGGRLDVRQRIFVQTRRRDLILALEGRQQREVL